MLLKMITGKGSTNVCAFLGQCRVWAGLPNRAKHSTTDSLQPPHFLPAVSALVPLLKQLRGGEGNKTQSPSKSLCGIQLSFFVGQE